MHRRVWLNLGVTVVLLLAATFSSLVLGGLIGGTANAQMLFLLAVLLIARFTDGYLWSVGASIVSVPLVNYMFTYPYFHRLYAYYEPGDIRGYSRRHGRQR